MPLLASASTLATTNPPVLRLIPAAGRRLFLLADRLFARAFGNAANPLYYLGSISCALFALVTLSGL